MLNVDNVMNPGLRRMLPDEMKDRGYVKVAKDDVKTIIDVAYSVYQAKSKDGEPIATKKGDPILNCTAYVGFDDSTIASFKNDKAIGQLASETGDVPITPGVYYVKLAQPVKVKIIEIKVKYGDKEYPSLAFEPM